MEYTFQTFGISPSNAVFWGFLGICTSATPWFLHTKNKRTQVSETVRNHYWLLIIISVLSAIGMNIWWYMIAQSGGGIAALIWESKTLWAILLGVLLLGEHLSWKQTLGILIAIAGIASIGSLEGEIQWSTVLLGLGGSLCYALQSFCIKKFGSQTHALTVSYLRGWIIVIILGPIFWFGNQLSLIPYQAIILLTTAQAFGSLLHKALFFQAHKLLPISHISLFNLLGPLLILVAGFILFEAEIGLQKIIGTILILGGLFIFFKTQDRSLETSLENTK